MRCCLDGEMRKQCITLEHHIDRPAVGRHRRNILPVEQDAPVVRRLEAGEHAQQRGLAAARRAEQRKEFAGEYIERHAIDRGHAGEALAHAREPHQRARRRVGPRREGTSRVARVPRTPLVLRVGGALSHLPR
jgi:hypothetical protein